MTNAYVGPECDVGTCPAAGSRTFILFDQDFHFCQHHAREVDTTLGGVRRPPAPAPEPTRASGPVDEYEIAFATSW